MVDPYHLKSNDTNANIDNLFQEMKSSILGEGSDALGENRDSRLSEKVVSQVMMRVVVLMTGMRVRMNVKAILLFYQTTKNKN